MSATHEFSEGDLVQIEDGDLLHRSRLAASTIGGEQGRLYVAGLHRHPYVDSFTPGSITLIEPATPKVVLPTEAGIYADKDGDLWVGELNAHGRIEWFFEREFKASSVADISAPFTRLEPVPVTAKAVIDSVRTHAEVIIGGCATAAPKSHNAIDRVLDFIGTDFGVQS